MMAKQLSMASGCHCFAGCSKAARPVAVRTLESAARARGAVGVSRAARLIARAADPGRGGAGVLDRPAVAMPGQKQSTDKTRKKPPIYKVLLHNDNYNKREYVVQVLMVVVEGLTKDDAQRIMEEAHQSALALVIACAQDQAETYVERLRLNGLVSTLEPGH